MKRTLLFICTLLCANVLLAQLPIGSGFYYEDIMYEVTSENEVRVYHPRSYYYGGDCPSSIEIPSVAIYHMEIPGQGTFHEEYSVTSIREEAFLGCSTLTSITIPNSVTSIGEEAFRDCSNLISVTIGNGVTSIGDMAFYGCSSLTSIDIPNSVTSIGIGAFAGCSSLTSVTIPSSVAFMRGFTFENCYNLRIVNYNAINCSLEYLDHFVCNYSDSEFLNGSCPVHTINIGDSVQRIPNYFFGGLDSLTSIYIPNSITSIGSAFAYCSSLTSVTFEENINLDSIEAYSFSGCCSLTSIDIPNSVTSIGDGAFFDCSSLTSITFGESLAEIGENAFATSSLLQNITCLGTNPPILYNNSFPNPNIAIVTVPCGSLEAYSAPTSFWNMLFTDRIEEDCGGETGLEDLNAVEISFFPNPTNSKVTFNQAIERIELIDLAGKTLRTFRNESEINIEQLPAGVYYLRLTNNEKQTLRKLIKE